MPSLPKSRFFIIITVQSDIMYVIMGEGKVVYSLDALFGLPRKNVLEKALDNLFMANYFSVIKTVWMSL